MAGTPAPAASAPDGRTVTAVFSGGVVGALLRAAAHETWTPAAGAWPWATFLVNVLGAFVLGLVVVCFAAGDARRALLGSGLCGALTTFSTLQLEVVVLADDGDLALAAGYAAASLGCGLVAYAAGRRAAPR